MSGLTFLFFKQRILDAIIYMATYFKADWLPNCQAIRLFIYFTIKSP